MIYIIYNNFIGSCMAKCKRNYKKDIVKEHTEKINNTLVLQDIQREHVEDVWNVSASGSNPSLDK